MNAVNRRQKKATLMGCILFFAVTTFLIMVSVLIYDFVNTKSNQNKAVISIVMIIVIIVFAASATIFDYIRRKIMNDKPMSLILDMTDKMTEGDFSTRVEPLHSFDKYNEYDLIIDNLNVLASELSKNEILKSDFIANVSHEIKTPISIIQNYAMAIQGKNLSAETRDEYAKTLVKASQRLANLITNILKMNKLENQEILPDKKEINLGECLSESILQFEELLEKKELNLECDIEDITIYSDLDLLEIVWNNLLSNAVKFTPNGGVIKISLKKEGQRILIEVSDSGCGMTPETGNHIFDKFYQGDTSHSQEGNGLGLSLVKKVVDILGGEISVRSTLGKGSTFTVSLKDVFEK